MQTNFAFIGGGNMGRALIGGLIAGGCSASAIRVADPSEQARAACATSFGVSAVSEAELAVANADVVVLAVKPQQMAGVASSLQQKANTDSVFVSIAAGITLDHLATWLGPEVAIVRAMPNTPALVNQGVTVLVSNPCTSESQQALATSLLSSVGRVEWVADESLMDAVTALSGSGPAYFFQFIEHLEQVGSELGLEAELARALAVETAFGAARLARESDQPPAILRQQVTSPGGTTERALNTFAAGDLQGLIRLALTAARDRSIELANEANS